MVHCDTFLLTYQLKKQLFIMLLLLHYLSDVNDSLETQDSKIFLDFMM